MGIKYDGMPKPEEQELPEDVNEDELIGFIMRSTSNHPLNFQQVKAVLDAEEQFLIEKGYIDSQ